MANDKSPSSPPTTTKQIPTTMAKDKSTGLTWAVVAVLFAVLFPVYKTFLSTDPLHFMYPNLLLFTPFRKLSIETWGKTIKYDEAVTYEPAPIPEIQGENFSMESLKVASENFRFPVIIRGIFKDAPALTKWITPEYLPSKLGEFVIPAVREATYGTIQNNRTAMPFKDAFGEIISDKNSKMYLFFPVKSRMNYNFSALGTLQKLQDTIDQFVGEDLELSKRIWKGFGTKAHSTFFGAQLIVGQGSNDTAATTGTGWHCAAGNNWFAQVAGHKRWYFIDPKYSAYLQPLRGGKVNMMTGTRQMGKFQRHVPTRFVDVHAGDLLYNPDWEWHTIMNYEGLSIGVPIREVNMTYSFQNNFQYTSIVALNKLFDRFGIDIGGYPPN